MSIQRYIPTKAVLDKDNKLVPIWDSNIKFNESDYYGYFLTFEGGLRSKHLPLVDCIFDLKTKQLSTGIELESYPESTFLKKGDSAYYEKSHRQIQEVIIADIVFEKYDLTIRKGSDMEDYEKSHFKNVVFQPDLLYSIKYWKPFYILNDGTKVEWEHKLYRKV